MKGRTHSASRRDFAPGQSTALGSMNLPAARQSTFGEVVSFVSRHSPLITLSDDLGEASIAVWPAMQGRVLTSSLAGLDGQSYGWINRELIASGEIREHINAVGGEDRIWIGPEGGQFSIFFAPGVPFDLDHWYTPAPLDIEPFDIVSQNNTSIGFRRAFRLTNYSGTGFSLQIEREVRLLSTGKIWSHLGINQVAGVGVVGFESENRLTNLASQSWEDETGLLSLWVLGQFQSAPKTTIILPIHAGSQEELGVPVTSDYFGVIPPDRLSIAENAVFFKADANHRGKLGLSLRRAKGLLGSYDALHHVLTIVQYSQPAGAQKYVNSAWKIQDDPYSGDVANCYNDGPPSAGLPQFGHFYELESSSPAKALNLHEAVTHTHRTVHLAGPEEQLDSICRDTLGVSLEAVRKFNP
jgi:Family of unknown function (DUF6786)